MKGKLIGFSIALLAVATIGIVQLDLAAKDPGQVGNAPRCTVEVKGQRAKAFQISENGERGTVEFTVKGQKNCKVQLSTNSFYAPSADGKPYNQQKLYDRNTRVFERGNHSMGVKVPVKSNKQQGCFYQIDLTYGIHNVTPVLAYGHGKVNCGPENHPEAACDSLTVAPLPNNSFRFDTKASAKDAQIKGYTYAITKDGAAVASQNFASTSKTHSWTYSQATPGTYSVKVTVKSSLGEHNGENCVRTFTIPEKPTPTPTAACDSLTATVHDRTEVRLDAKASVTNGATISGYEFAIMKDGDTVETNTVTSTATTASWTSSQAEAGIYSAKVTVKTSVSDKTGTQCEATFTVDTPEKPKKEKVRVCNPETGEIIVVNKKDADKYLDKDSKECKDTVVPPELPETGPAETAMQAVGLTSLFGASAYYLTSRRNW